MRASDDVRDENELRTRDEVRSESDLRTREKEIIIEAVKNNASRKQAAEKLGISPRTLRYKMARFRKQEVGTALPA